jgi:hypothetical protein
MGKYGGHMGKYGAHMGISRLLHFRTYIMGKNGGHMGNYMADIWGNMADMWTFHDLCIFGHLGKIGGHMGKYGGHIGKYSGHMGKYSGHMGKYGGHMGKNVGHMATFLLPRTYGNLTSGKIMADIWERSGSEGQQIFGEFHVSVIWETIWGTYGKYGGHMGISRLLHFRTYGKNCLTYGKIWRTYWKK